jgi:ferric-dicitrate binding protein FerR (iron transport regulator)
VIHRREWFGALLAIGLALAVGWVLRPLWSARASGDAPPRSIMLRTGHTELQGGTVVDLSDHGVAEWSPADQQHPRLALSRGSMALAVTHQPAGSVLEVTASHYVFRVLSARFWVARSEHVTRLEVTEGQVAVMQGNSSVAQVSAGQSWEGVSGGGRASE